MWSVGFFQSHHVNETHTSVSSSTGSLSLFGLELQVRKVYQRHTWFHSPTLVRFYWRKVTEVRLFGWLHLEKQNSQKNIKRLPTNQMASKFNCIKSYFNIDPHCLLIVVCSENLCSLQWIHHLRWKVYDNLIFLVRKYMKKPSGEG